VIEVDGVTVPRALITELAHQLVHRDEFQTASNLLTGLASGEPSIPLGENDRTVIRAALETSPAGLERLRDALVGKTPYAAEGTPGREHADHTYR
jgi:hypothetical protein